MSVTIPIPVSLPPGTPVRFHGFNTAPRALIPVSTPRRVYHVYADAYLIWRAPVRVGREVQGGIFLMSGESYATPLDNLVVDLAEPAAFDAVIRMVACNLGLINHSGYHLIRGADGAWSLVQRGMPIQLAIHVPEDIRIESVALAVIARSILPGAGGGQ